MESEPQQVQQGNCAVPSPVPVLVPQVPFLPQLQLGLGGFPPQPPQGYVQQVNPYLTAGVPQLPVIRGSYASIAGSPSLQGFQQFVQQLPPYTVPPGPPSEDNTAAARVQQQQQPCLPELQ